ncbi:SDR family oxidoreductase [Aquicoccus sp. G2-2]|uniref:SDR family NAD(P)-dependent oxidoreductase n=1 Tax=Aquicoccus sp. G2-2 TaxID=3092120 RepID=UPI002ADF45F2|nr:SDR family oxidoreductase [Aquicoccus sp. G2-2]MEA1112164.1 SDR family oxidoreductase [Aquicoccus sp. G2-2]
MPSLFSLDGKVAIITGSSRGIGYAIALEMAHAGARVVISSRKAPACEQAAAAINAATGRDAAIPIAANISDKAALNALVEQTRTTLGPIDILVCNAASNPYYGPLTDIPDESFRKILDNNVVANNWLIGMVAPDMKARKDGAIIIVSSIGGLEGSSVIGAYNISKAADMQLARNLAVEFGGDNIRVNCIAPGLIKTAFSKALWDNPDTLTAYKRRTPLKRPGAPAEIAGAAVFLAAPAGAFVTGQTIVVDGGTTIQGI